MHPPVYAGNTPRLVPRNVGGHSMSGHVSCSVILRLRVVLTSIQMHIYRRQSSSCPFLATSANGQVPFVPVWRASGVGVAVRFENPVHTTHSPSHRSPNRIPLASLLCRRFRFLLPRKALCQSMLGKSRVKHRADPRKIDSQSPTRFQRN